MDQYINNKNKLRSLIKKTQGLNSKFNSLTLGLKFIVCLIAGAFIHEIELH